MTVSELIEELKRLPQEKTVFLMEQTLCTFSSLNKAYHCDHEGLVFLEPHLFPEFKDDSQ